MRGRLTTGAGYVRRNVSGDPEALLAALNAMGQRVQLLWTSFVLFGAYITIAVLGTTHRMLLLEDPIRLPVFNVDLPLTSFYVLAPGFLLIFHFYILTQLVLFARTVNAFNHAAMQLTPDNSNKLRLRLDNSVFLQRLAGAEPERRGRNAWLFIRLLGWLTVVALPVALFLLIQLQFLPYHHLGVTTVHRIAQSADLILLFIFWTAYARGGGLPSLRMYVTGSHWLSRSASGLKTLAAAGAAVVITLFCYFVAVFPTEHNYNNSITRALGTFTSRLNDSDGWRRDLHDWILSWRVKTWTRVESKFPNFRSALMENPKEENTFSFTELLLEPSVNYVVGRPAGFFSNVLVITDEVLVDDSKIKELDLIESGISPGKHRLVRSFRGRDLAKAVLDGADLRRADFTGANLKDAQLNRAKLARAQFGCALKGKTEVSVEQSETRWPTDGCTWLDNASLDFADLEDASLEHAHLSDVSLVKTNLRGASLTEAVLTNAVLRSAQIQGATLDGVKLQHARLDYANLQGASLKGAELQGASFRGAKLQGASLQKAMLEVACFSGADLRGTSFDFAKLNAALLIKSDLRGASLKSAELQGADLTDVQLQGASLVGTALWRARGEPGSIELASFDAVPDVLTRPFQPGDFESWRNQILSLLKEMPKRHQKSTKAALNVLDPGRSDPKDATTAKLRENLNHPVKGVSQDKSQMEQQIAMLLMHLACSADDAPFVAHGLVQNGRLLAAGKNLPDIVDKLKNPDGKNCPGAKGLAPKDIKILGQLLTQTSEIADKSLQSWGKPPRNTTEETSEHFAQSLLKADRCQ